MVFYIMNSMQLIITVFNQIQISNNLMIFKKIFIYNSKSNLLMEFKRLLFNLIKIKLFHYISK